MTSDGAPLVPEATVNGAVAAIVAVFPTDVPSEVTITGSDFGFVL